jgi:hypothetical protein
LQAGGELRVAAQTRRSCARLALRGAEGIEAAGEASEGELMMTIETLCRAYARLCGAHEGSVVRGVSRTLANRTAVGRAQR